MEKKFLSELKVIKILLICLLVILTLNTCYIMFSGGNGSGSTNQTGEETEEYDVSMFTAIDQTKFMSNLKSKDLKVTYFGRSSCGYCIQFLPTMQKAQTNLKFEMNYVDITKVDAESDDYKKMVELINAKTDDLNKRYGLTGSDEAYKYLYGYTPMVTITQNGKVVDVWVGYSDYDTFVSWLNDAGVK